MALLKHAQILYEKDALWDAKQCRHDEEDCCHRIPWFHKLLPAETSDNIEMRVCTNWDDEDVPIAFYDIYVK